MQDFITKYDEYKSYLYESIGMDDTNLKQTVNVVHNDQDIVFKKQDIYRATFDSKNKFVELLVNQITMLRANNHS